MATNAGQFKKGHGGRPKGALSKLTLDQREMFDEAVPRSDRIMLIRSVVQRALGGNDKVAAPYMKLCFEFLFSKPRQGHDVSVMNMEEVMTPEVCAGVWREISAEARLRDAKRKATPRLEVIEAQVLGTKAKGDGRKMKSGKTRQS